MVSGKESTFLGWESTFLGIKTTLFGRNLRSLCALLSVVSRSSLGGIRQGIREVKEICNLNKSTFLVESLENGALRLFKIGEGIKIGPLTWREPIFYW